jgi:hypothetical protein
MYTPYAGAAGMLLNKWDVHSKKFEITSFVLNQFSLSVIFVIVKCFRKLQLTPCVRTYHMMKYIKCTKSNAILSKVKYIVVMNKEMI